ncbi:uncharacterized protein MONBRDRAFT_34445 [Monosiga brevicollis MX1]|uniref:SANT domain-containing protein n=1 Tax=Monosiga brevicollis TaxID=81824 RepID=A9VBU2_MONBE|nr:uncharacterized protein MONBRDRAFT_34445 [Monosiga brevicollis MX1]EDQ85037.1 predicted protein [Monosiga brevicollis MX1]|eukprot:XP_001750207.1 hypothetical protein [Monosiga brevicollis MX1]
MPREFTFHELDMFEIGLSAFGKNFPAIQRRYLSHRSVREVVRCYYDWKRTPRYDLWVMVSGFHGEQREALIEQIAESVERSRSPHALPSNLTLGDATLETASEWVASADTLTAASDQTSGAPDPAKATLAVTAGLLSSPRHNTGDADVDIDFLSPIKDLESIAGSLASEPHMSL